MKNQSDKAMRVQQVYSELDRKFEEQETERLAIQQNIPYINLYGYPADTQALKLIPQAESERLGAIVFFKEGRSLKLGIVESSEKLNPLIKKLSDEGYFVSVFMISKSSYRNLAQGYSKVVIAKISTDKIDLNSKAEWSLKGLSQMTATKILEQILGTALKLNASDVHVEPEAGAVKIRFRIDGVLIEAGDIPVDNHHQFVSRVKILAKLKLNVSATPQDGSLSLTFDNNQVDIRVSVLPTAFGESIVMRILRQDKGSLKFEELGITGLARDRILQQMQKPNGMILTTGPTGSGKTTTLYAILNKLNEPGVKIITLEDPVEYRVEGITQTPIDARAGMTFAEGLRAVLRQDPDIVMVGEMRDMETAEIACQAALTGHVVLSTLHTNDAPAAIPRLMDLGTKPFVLAPAINAIIGQRLVRKLCEHCKEEYKLPENLMQRVKSILTAVPKAAKVEFPKVLRFYHSRGCDQCHKLGYRGRIGVYEVFTISETIEGLITKGATTTEIKKQAIEEGMITMAQDGILKALQGQTDVEEVFRVTE